MACFPVKYPSNRDYINQNKMPFYRIHPELSWRPTENELLKGQRTNHTDSDYKCMWKTSAIVKC